MRNHTSSTEILAESCLVQPAVLHAPCATAPCWPSTPPTSDLSTTPRSEQCKEGASTARGMGSVPGQETNIPRATLCCQKNKAKKENLNSTLIYMD